MILCSREIRRLNKPRNRLPTLHSGYSKPGACNGRAKLDQRKKPCNVNTTSVREMLLALGTKAALKNVFLNKSNRTIFREKLE